jgi:3-oxoacyl-[acyl-carrier protein] reductase
MSTIKRVILVTGANGGLGQAIARAFLSEHPDDSVWLGVCRNRDSADKLCAEFPGRCRVVTLDVTNPDSWKVSVAQILAADQRLDVLVNNAGTHEDTLLGQMPPESWRRVISSNLDGAFHGCQAVLPAMISQRHGRIVNIASLSALLAPPGQTNYAAAKAGLVALSQSLAKEVARIGITVNALCPGYIDTGIFASFSPEELNTLRARVPMRRLGKPEEAAAPVLFLASTAASYITGAVLKVDGGVL